MHIYMQIHQGGQQSLYYGGCSKERQCIDDCSSIWTHLDWLPECQWMKFILLTSLDGLSFKLRRYIKHAEKENACRNPWIYCVVVRIEKHVQMQVVVMAKYNIDGVLLRHWLYSVLCIFLCFFSSVGLLMLVTWMAIVLPWSRLEILSGIEFTSFCCEEFQQC